MERARVADGSGADEDLQEAVRDAETASGGPPVQIPLKRRGLLGFLVRSILTLGIYDLFYHLRRHAELRATVEDTRHPFGAEGTLWPVFFLAPYFIIVIFIAGLAMGVIAPGQDANGSPEPWHQQGALSATAQSEDSGSDVWPDGADGVDDGAAVTRSSYDHVGWRAAVTLTGLLALVPGVLVVRRQYALIQETQQRLDLGVTQPGSFLFFFLLANGGLALAPFAPILQWSYLFVIPAYWILTFEYNAIRDALLKWRSTPLPDVPA